MIRPLIFRARKVPSLARWLHATSSTRSYDQRYAERLQQKAKEKGLSLDELKTQARDDARRKQKEDASPLLESIKKKHNLSQVKTLSNSQDSAGTSPTRKDSSPVKPLSSVLNVSKLLATPHTSSQISALWTAYHASRSGGTGRGFICATLPVESYNAMTQVARKYPLFVVPVPRQSTPEKSADENSGTAHEFYFLQWDFHPAPPAPTAMEPNPFQLVTSSQSSTLPPISTVLYTPLQEYKLRTSFATPYLVLTFYTDLAESHGIVLLRGEITPSSTSAAADAGQETLGRFLLSQVDAQLLTMGLQRFYLWGESSHDGQQDSSAEKLLKRFHEKPEEFSWQDLIEHSKLTM